MYIYKYINWETFHWGRALVDIFQSLVLQKTQAVQICRILNSLMWNTTIVGESSHFLDWQHKPTEMIQEIKGDVYIYSYVTWAVLEKSCLSLSLSLPLLPTATHRWLIAHKYKHRCQTNGDNLVELQQI